jgi:hypothetical protein
MTPTDVAAAQRTSAKTAHRRRNRFEAEGVDELLEHPRSARPTDIDKKIIDKVMFLTTSRTRRDAGELPTPRRAAKQEKSDPDLL